MPQESENNGSDKASNMSKREFMATMLLQGFNNSSSRDLGMLQLKPEERQPIIVRAAITQADMLIAELAKG